MPSPRIIATYTIGNSDTDDAKRRVGWQLDILRWRGFVDRHIANVLRDGYAGIELHNPFGVLSTEEMLASQAVDARRAGLWWLIADFAEAWKPVVQAGVEVIAYPGSLKLDAKLKTMAVHGGPPFRDYLMNCYQPCVAAGCSLGFDTHHQLPKACWEHVALRRMMTWVQGINPKARGYIEPWPHISDADWFLESNGIMGQLNIWIASHNNLIAREEQDLPRNADVLWPIPDNREVVVHLTRHPTIDTPVPFASWGPAFIRKQLDMGRSVAVAPQDLKAVGMTPRDFV